MICVMSSSSFALLQFVDVLNKIWCYYEAFLGQTQMLNATPIRELANKFLGLTVSVFSSLLLPPLISSHLISPYAVCGQTLHQQLQSYRSEQLKAAEKLCSCRHSSKLADVSCKHFHFLSLFSSPSPHSCFHPPLLLHYPSCRDHYYPL